MRRLSRNDIVIAALISDIAINAWVIFQARERSRAWDRAMNDEFNRIKNLRASDLAKMTDEELIDGALRHDDGVSGHSS